MVEQICHNVWIIYVQTKLSGNIVSRCQTNMRQALIDILIISAGCNWSGDITTHYQFYWNVARAYYSYGGSGAFHRYFTCGVGSPYMAQPVICIGCGLDITKTPKIRRNLGTELALVYYPLTYEETNGPNIELSVFRIYAIDI